MLQLTNFDVDYFHSLEGDNAWIAIGHEEYQKNYSNQRYFTVIDHETEHLGIVGIYDFDNQKNLTHIVIDPKHRNKGLLKDIYCKLMEETGVRFLIATINVKNIASKKAHEKVGFIKISDEAFENEFHKFKYKYVIQNNENPLHC